MLDWQGVVTLGGDPLVISSSQLALTPEEARAEAPELGSDALHNLWKVSEGAYLDFLTGYGRILGRGVPEVPTLKGTTRRPLGEEILVEPAILLDVLLLQSRLVEALDVACRNVPHRVGEVVAEAGPIYQDQGLLERLYLNLRSLDESYLEDERVLEWLLVAAVGIGRAESILPLMEAFLETHPALDLRTRYVGLIRDLDTQLSEAAWLAETHPTPLSLFQWGRLHRDPREGVAILRRGVGLAEEGGRPYEAVRNASALAERLIHAGAFSEGQSWGEWALRQFDMHGLADGQRRLLLLNNWAYARIVTGQLGGLRDELWSVQGRLEGVLPELAALFRSTLAEVELVHRHLDEAANLSQTSVWQSSRRWLGKYIVTYVRMLLEADRLREARKEAQLAFDISQGEPYAKGAGLALGMVTALTDPESAVAGLEAIMMDAFEPAERRCVAALYYLLATERRFETLPAGVQGLFEDVHRSGLRLFSGPERLFAPLWGQILAGETPLRIEALGRGAVWLNGRPVELTPFLMGLLTVVALHPEGITLEALHTLVYPEEVDRFASLKVNLSRLRKLVPLSSSPYRLTVDYSVDVLELEALLTSSRLREAQALYHGPLLEASTLPFLEERREVVDELLRQTVLASDDPEVLFDLAQRQRDLELWERTAEVLARLHDPRLAVARAMVGRVAREYGL